MGSVSRDIDKKSREYDDSYPYEAAGIAALLRDIHSLSESREYKGDIDATILIVDLKQALDSECLTPRMRQVVSLYYFSQMTEQEVAAVIGMSQQKVNVAIKSAIERVATFMEYGYSGPTNAKIDGILKEIHPFYTWLNGVASRKKPVYSFTEELTDWLALKGDKRAVETIRQSKEGYTYTPVYENEEKEYPAITWDQMQWKDRRISYKPEIYPPNTVLGFRKVSIKLEDDSKSSQEWRYERRKIFI
jgi:hypothetical protein